MSSEQPSQLRLPGMVRVKTMRSLAWHQPRNTRELHDPVLSSLCLPAEALGAGASAALAERPRVLKHLAIWSAGTERAPERSPFSTLSFKSIRTSQWAFPLHKDRWFQGAPLIFLLYSVPHQQQTNWSFSPNKLESGVPLKRFPIKVLNT